MEWEFEVNDLIWFSESSENPFRFLVKFAEGLDDHTGGESMPFHTLTPIKLSRSILPTLDFAVERKLRLLVKNKAEVF